MGGLLKGKTGFLGRSRASLEELQSLGRDAAHGALATLEKLTRTPVETGPSQVFLGPRAALAAILARHAETEVASRFRFTGSAPGLTAILIAKADAARLAELLLGREKGSVKRFGALEESAIAETANIALNGALNAVARTDDVRFHPGVPEVEYRVKDLGAYLAPEGGGDHVIVVDTAFREPTRDVAGSILVVFALESSRG